MLETSPFLFFVLAGSALIIAELLIFNLSVFWFLFVGIGAIVTAFVTLLLPDMPWIYAWLIFIITSIVVSAALYKPLRAWQKKPGIMPGNDVVGQSVDALEDIAPNTKGKVNWSGATWEAKLVDSDETLKQGASAKIIKAEGIILYISHS